MPMDGWVWRRRGLVCGGDQLGLCLTRAIGGDGCLLCPTLSKDTLGGSREGGLGALAPDWAVRFLQPKRLPAGRVPLPVTPLSLEN